MGYDNLIYSTFNCSFMPRSIISLHSTLNSLSSNHLFATSYLYGTLSKPHNYLCNNYFNQCVFHCPRCIPYPSRSLEPLNLRAITLTGNRFFISNLNYLYSLFQNFEWHLP